MTIIFDKINTLKNVEILRNAMIKSGIENGLNHPTTIKLSQKLDKLLNEYLITNSSPISLRITVKYCYPLKRIKKKPSKARFT